MELNLRFSKIEIEPFGHLLQWPFSWRVLCPTINLWPVHGVFCRVCACGSTITESQNCRFTKLWLHRNVRVLVQIVPTQSLHVCCYFLPSTFGLCIFFSLQMRSLPIVYFDRGSRTANWTSALDIGAWKCNFPAFLDFDKPTDRHEPIRPTNHHLTNRWAWGFIGRLNI